VNAKIAAALVAAFLTLPAAAAALAATTVSLNVQGGYGNRTLKACGIIHHYTLYRHGRAIKVSGAVLPAPGGTPRIKLKVKRCLNGRFRTVWIGLASPQAAGTFQGIVPPRKLGFYFVRAYYKGTTVVKSDKQYFRAT
jgi:hypothetical protein